MGRWVHAALRLVIVAALLGSVVVQVVMVPLAALDVREEGGDLGRVWWVLGAVAFLLMVVLQVCAVCVWRLLRMVERGTVFTSASFRFVDAIIVAIASASVLLLVLGAALAPGDAAAPGTVLLIGGAGGVVAGIALIVLVMRMLLAQAVARDAEAQALQAELDEVI